MKKKAKPSVNVTVKLKGFETAPTIIDKGTSILNAVELIGKLANEIAETFGIDKKIAIRRAIAIVEKNSEINLNPLKELAKDDVDTDELLTPTRIGEIIGGLHPAVINNLLVYYGLQKRSSRYRYELTQKGRKYGKIVPCHNWSTRVVRWKPAVIDEIGRASCRERV